jgi:hypothetical protein
MTHTDLGSPKLVFIIQICSIYNRDLLFHYTSKMYVRHARIFEKKIIQHTLYSLNIIFFQEFRDRNLIIEMNYTQ